MVGYERRNQYCIYDPVCHAVFVRRDMIFDETSIRPQSDNPSVNPTAAPESEVALGFLSFCFPYIPWINNVLPANVPENSKSATALELTQSQPDAKDVDTPSNLSDIPDESDKDTPTAETPLSNVNTAISVQRQSVCLKSQPTLDYQMIHQ